MKGVEKIERRAFGGCTSLKSFKVPSTLKIIGDYAFSGCGQLVEVQLNEGLAEIGMFAFSGCKSLKHFKVPSTVKSIGLQAFCDCSQLMSVDLCRGIEKIALSAFKNCPSLRNIAVRPGTQAWVCFGEGNYDLMQFGSSQRMNDILKSRFDGLPIHSLCYCSTDADMDQISNVVRLMPDLSEAPLDTSNEVHSNQDSLGMTPLHILACSSKQNIDLYRFTIASHPNSLITEDKWGCIPILYAIWGGAPEEITQFLLNIHKSTFPNYILDWDV